MAGAGPDRTEPDNTHQDNTHQDDTDPYATDPDVDGGRSLLAAFLPRRDARYLLTVAAVGATVATVSVLRAPAVSMVPALIGLAGFSTVIAAGDAVTHRIPNPVNVAAGSSALFLLTLARTGWSGSLTGAALGAVAAFAVYLVLWLVAPGALGAGDVKLAPYLGAYLGFLGITTWWHGLFLGVLVQGALAAIGLLSGRLRRGDHLAHGPAMCAGAVLAVLAALGPV